MNSLLLSSVVGLCALENVMVVFFNRHTKNNSTYIFGAISSFCAMLFFIATIGGSFDFNPAFLPYSLGFGLAFATSSIFSVQAMRCGSVSLTALIGNYSLILPTLYGLIFLHEPSSVWLFLGIAFLLISLFFIYFKKGDLQISKKWILYIILYFVGGGMCSVVQKMEQVAFNGGYKNEFMIVALAFVVIAMTEASFIKVRREILPTLKKGGIYCVLYGIANGAVNMLVMMLSGRMSASVMFPIISVGTIIIILLISRFAFKEYLTRMQWIGVLFGIAAIIFLNL